jgi:hypothetical protein
MELAIKANSYGNVDINQGKVGFLWQVSSDKPIDVLVDGMPIKCGHYMPPFVVKKGVVFNSKTNARVLYEMEIFNDIHENQTKKKKRIIKTEEVAPVKPHIVNHILNNANEWYEIPIPKDIRTWSMNARGNYDILYSFETSHSTYRTLFSGMFLDSDTSPNNINKIYVSCATAGAVVEIIMYR